jgi:hypothetical protein
MEALVDRIKGYPGVVACFALGRGEKVFAFHSALGTISSEGARRSAVVMRETVKLLPLRDLEWIRIECEGRDLLITLTEEGIVAVLGEPGIDRRGLDPILAGAAEAVAAAPSAKMSAGAVSGVGLSAAKSAAVEVTEGEAGEEPSAGAEEEPAAAVGARQGLPEGGRILPPDLVSALSRRVAEVVGGFGDRIVENAIEEVGLDHARPAEARVLEFCDSVEAATRLLLGSTKARELRESLEHLVKEARGGCTE